MTKRMLTSQRSGISLGIATMVASLLGTWMRGKVTLAHSSDLMCPGLINADAGGWCLFDCTANSYVIFYV